jgi:SPP1 family predicted phage head-tail adaptor
MNLDRVIELHAPTTTRNLSGQYVTTFATQGNFYAALNPTTAREDNSGSQMYGLEVVRWAVRYNDAIKHTWRVIHNNDEYDVIGIMHNGRRTYTTLICKLRDNDQ